MAKTTYLSYSLYPRIHFEEAVKEALAKTHHEILSAGLAIPDSVLLPAITRAFRNFSLDVQKRAVAMTINLLRLNDVAATGNILTTGDYMWAKAFEVENEACEPAFSALCTNSPLGPVFKAIRPIVEETPFQLPHAGTQSRFFDMAFDCDVLVECSQRTKVTAYLSQNQLQISEVAAQARGLVSRIFRAMDELRLPIPEERFTTYADVDDDGAHGTTRASGTDVALSLANALGGLTTAIEMGYFFSFRKYPTDGGIGREEAISFLHGELLPLLKPAVDSAFKSLAGKMAGSFSTEWRVMP